MAWKTSFGVWPDVSSVSHRSGIAKASLAMPPKEAVPALPVRPFEPGGRRVLNAEVEVRALVPDQEEHHGRVAQEEERFSDTEEAAGSSPALPTTRPMGE